jgi:patatin-related protein
MDKPSFHREIRLGLVVYGGVSLSIYMNGVCREFYNAVRGRGIYKLIKALTDSDIVVDIISGTSAGGINGVLLAYALANSTKEVPYEFENFSGIWRDSGDIMSLLRKPGDASTQEINSFLNGEIYYQNKLTEAFVNVHNKAVQNNADTKNTDWFSEFDELDLFVTGTDVIGKVNREFDYTGKLIETKDHRAVFILKHRQGRKEPFKILTPLGNRTADHTLLERTEVNKENINARALAKLCRITSCFPVAFPVVTVFTEGSDEVDKLLIKWGDLGSRIKLPGVTNELYFVDGGVLDNRPFSYTIDEIYHRHYWRPVKRMLFYIDPSPDEFTKSQSPAPKREKPNIWQTAVDSLVGLPRYESIAADLQHIARHNLTARRYRLLRSSLKQMNEDSSNKNHDNQHSENDYLRYRLFQLRDRVLPLLTGINEDHENQRDSLKNIARIVGARVQKREEQQREKILVKYAREYADSSIDIDFSIRQHFFMLEEISQIMEDMLAQPGRYGPEETSHMLEKLRELAEKLSKQLSLLEVVKYVVDTSMQNRDLQKLFIEELAQLQNEDIMKTTKRVYEYIINISCLFLRYKYYAKLMPEESQEVITNTLKADEIKQVINQIEAELIKRVEGPKGLDPESKSASVLERIYEQSLAIIKNSFSAADSDSQKIWNAEAKDLLDKFNNFKQTDRVLYPFEFLSDFQTDDQIEVVRVSPVDADKGFGKGKPIEKRLAGSQLRGFGGFFKKSWRSNDILWGRLDGLNRLVDALITEESVANFPSFCHADPEGRKGRKLLEDVLVEILSEDSDAKDAAIKKLDEFFPGDGCEFVGAISDLQEWLVELGQSSILKTDLEQVFLDGVSQQKDWNQYKQSPSQKTPQFLPGQAGLDRGLSLMAVEHLVNDSMAEMKKRPDGLQTFFRDKYGIGSERIENDLPPMIQRQLIASFGLVLRDILRSGPTRGFASKSVLFNLSNRALQAYDLIAKYSRRSQIFRILFPVLIILIPLSLFFSVIHPFLNSINDIVRSLLFLLLLSALITGIFGWKILRLGSFLLALILMLNLLFGLPVKVDSSIKLKRYFSLGCPFVPTKYTLSGCAKK